MQEVAIIGAGELGGAVAHVLARRDLVAIDHARSTTRARVAAGKALDIAQAAPVEGFATQLSGATDVSTAARRGDHRHRRSRRRRRVAGRRRAAAAEAAAQTAPRARHPLRRRVAARARRPRRPRAALSRARGCSARRRKRSPPRRARSSRSPSNGSPRDVALSVLGVPPAHTVIPWADATRRPASR